MAGVVNLYSLEFFRLARERLAPGGYVTYWLPLHLMEPRDARVITAAFCQALPDCTLWKGMGLSWMLMGTRDAPGRVSAERFTAQWRDAAAAPELRANGFERPEQMGALFIADVPPLADNYPHRLLPDVDGARSSQERWYVAMGDVSACRPRFEESQWILSHWPPEIRAATIPYFEWQAIFDRIQLWDRENGLPDLDRILTGSSLQALPLFLIGSAPEIQERVVAPLRKAGDDSRLVWNQEGKAHLARRDFAAAVTSFDGALARSEGPPLVETLRLRAYALARSGRREASRAALHQLAAVGGPPEAANVAFIGGIAGGAP